MKPLHRELEVIDSHTAGEPTRVVPMGALEIRGSTMAERRADLQARHDGVRRALTSEPRGYDAMVIAYLTPPDGPDADVGVVFANDAGYLGMCGHGAIGVATTLVRLGMVEATGPRVPVVLDTPVGRVSTEVAVEHGLPVSVRLRNVPSWLEAADVQVPVPGLGSVTADIAWGGNWFAFVAADEIGLPVDLDHLDALMGHARAIREALEHHRLGGHNPETGAFEPVDHVKLWSDESDADGPASRALTLCPGKAWDRSPCGTGTSAKLAVLHHHGQLAVGQTFRSRSVLGTEFRAEIVSTADVGGRIHLVPAITGSAWITGRNRVVFDHDDPLVDGIA